MSTPMVVVAALIADAEGRVLLNQRPPGTALAGLWEFPGGKVEPGEHPRAALLRECREEMACVVEVGAVYEIVHHRAGERDLLLLFYLARIIDGTPTPQEGNALAWATPEQMAAFDLLPADRPLPAAFRHNFPHYRPGALPA